MKAPTPDQIVWLIPLTMLIHQLEEYFGQFPQWFSGLLNAELSNHDFIILNVIGLIVISVFALSYFFNKKMIIPAILGVVIFANGVIHLVISILTFSYAPGTISGVVLLIPLGVIIFNTIMPQLKEGERIIAIVTGISALLIVSLLANMV